MSSAKMLDTASAIVTRARRDGAIVIVNDRADVAQLCGADGVHVGQDDLAPADARRVVGDRAMVGLSTHTLSQLDKALEEPISYVAIGPVFATATKDTGYRAVGLELVRAAADRVRRRGLPLVAIGGITIDSAWMVVDAGAASVAVIADLLVGGNPEARVREFTRQLS
jgi:thiamine-phosphate pyrophosphorylase